MTTLTKVIPNVTLLNLQSLVYASQEVDNFNTQATLVNTEFNTVADSLAKNSFVQLCNNVQQILEKPTNGLSTQPFLSALTAVSADVTITYDSANLATGAYTITVS